MPKGLFGKCGDARVPDWKKSMHYVGCLIDYNSPKFGTNDFVVKILDDLCLNFVNIFVPISSIFNAYLSTSTCLSVPQTIFLLSPSSGRARTLVLGMKLAIWSKSTKH